MIVILLDGKESNVNQPLYLKEFSTFYNTWQMNKFVGGGIKNFRYYCHVRPFIDPNSKFICNMHPHNYYLEILTETGIIGFTIILLIFFNVLFISFFKKYFSNLPLENNDKMIPFIFLFIAEIFPLKSTGSFFTTGNATYIFLILGIIIGLARSNNLIENKF
jgi:O-antigen ligase